jgi:hypothetical protein
MTASPKHRVARQPRPRADDMDQRIRVRASLCLGGRNGSLCEPDNSWVHSSGIWGSSALFNIPGRFATTTLSSDVTSDRAIGLPMFGLIGRSCAGD